MKTQELANRVEGTADNRSSSSAIAQEEWGVLIFRLEAQEYGLQLENVAEILRMVAITTVPEAENSIRGVINLRGEVVPILDLHQSLGLSAKPYTLDTHIIIVRENKHRFGLLVNCVTKVTTISPENVQLDLPGKHLLGIAKINGRMLFILDLSSILKQLKEDLPEKIIS